MGGIHFFCVCFFILAMSAPRIVLGKQNEAIADKNVKDDEGNPPPRPERIPSMVCVASLIFGALVCLAFMRSSKNHDRYIVRHVRHMGSDGTPLLEDVEALCGTKEPSSKQEVLFKRTIDATVYRTELVNLYKARKSVGILYWNNDGAGTVISIGPNFIITAWHVIKPIVMSPGKTKDGVTTPCIDVNNLKKVGIYADFREDTTQSNRDLCFELLPNIRFFDEEQGICILEMTENCGNFPEPILVFKDFELMVAGEKTMRVVHIIGHQSKAVVVDPGCKIISRDDKEFQTTKKYVKGHKKDIVRHSHDENDVLSSYNDVFETNLIIDTFLEIGASGGAVVSFIPEGEIALFALLLVGLPYWYWNKQKSEHGLPTSTQMEIACLIPHILKSKHSIDKQTTFEETQMETDELNFIKKEETQMETDELNFIKKEETQMETDELNFIKKEETQMETDELNFKEEEETQMETDELNINNEKETQMETDELNFIKKEETQMETDELNFKEEEETQMETDELNINNEKETQMETDELNFKKGEETQMETDELNFKKDEETLMETDELTFKQEDETQMETDELNFINEKETRMETDELNLKKKDETAMETDELNFIKKEETQMETDELNLKQEDETLMETDELNFINEEETQMETDELNLTRWVFSRTLVSPSYALSE